MNALAFDDLTLGYDGHPAVHHLTGAVQRGSLTAVIGPNGSGKSTLLKGIAGLLRPLAGHIAREETLSIAYLPQQSDIDRSFPARVVDLAALGLWSRRGMLGRVNAADRADIDSALAAVGLSGFQNRGIDTLSGGQLQRALFARVLLQDAGLILLDEPFNAVDGKTVEDLIALIARWQGERRTVLTVLHDVDLVRSHFPQALLLARSPVAWGPTADVLRPENLRQARRFHEGWDDHAPLCEHNHATPRRAA